MHQAIQLIFILYATLSSEIACGADETWKTYRDEKLRFEISYPADWNITVCAETPFEIAYSDCDRVMRCAADGLAIKLEKICSAQDPRCERRTFTLAVSPINTDHPLSSLELDGFVKPFRITYSDATGPVYFSNKIESDYKLAGKRVYLNNYHGFSFETKSHRVFKLIGHTETRSGYYIRQDPELTDLGKAILATFKILKGPIPSKHSKLH